MQTSFIVRLLDHDGPDRRVLAWTFIPAFTKGDGAIRAMHDFHAQGFDDAAATHINYHWPDVNVNLTFPLPNPVQVSRGKVVSVPLKDLVLVQMAGDTRPLPPVTVTQSVEVCPAGASR
jgi:hypothetical protein